MRQGECSGGLCNCGAVLLSILSFHNLAGGFRCDILKVGESGYGEKPTEPAWSIDHFLQDDEFYFFFCEMAHRSESGNRIYMQNSWAKLWQLR